MKKTLLLLTLITFTLINADTTNMSEEDMINQIMQMNKDIKEEKIKTIALKKKSKDMRKLRKTVDKLAKKLGID